MRTPKLMNIAEQFVFWDTRVCLSLNRINHRRFIQLFFGTVSRLGDGMIWYGLMIAMAMFGKWIPAIHMFAAGVAGVLLYKALKGVTSRPRPCTIRADILRTTEPLDQFSFPSGHTLHAVSFTLIAIAYFPVLAWVLIPFAFLVAMSRVILGLHYPSDVAVGALLGYGVSGALLMF
jgi:undecaprenyl-diphosphatase